MTKQPNASAKSKELQPTAQRETESNYEPNPISSRIHT